MNKKLFPIGLVILVISLLLVVIGPVGAVGECKLEIHKQDPNGEALAGATFVISPDPTDVLPELTVVDNAAGDEDDRDGFILLEGLNCDLEITYTVTETVAPPGCIPAPPQTVIIVGSTVNPIVLTFINEPIVGGEAQPVNTVGAFIPWIGLALAVVAGILFALKRRGTQS